MLKDAPWPYRSACSKQLSCSKCTWQSTSKPETIMRKIFRYYSNSRKRGRRKQAAEMLKSFFINGGTQPVKVLTEEIAPVQAPTLKTRV